MGNCQSVTTLQLQVVDPGKELLRCAEQGNTMLMAPVVACNLQYLSQSSVFGGNTIWHKAAKTGKVQVFETLEHICNQAFQQLQESKDLTDKRYGIRRLGSSAQDAIKRIINKPNLKGFTPLMLACMGSHTEAVAWLLKHGADAWKHDRMRRQTALHCAAQAGATDAIRYLLANAGDERDPGNGKTLLEQGNHAGLTALHYAVYCDQLEVMQQLLAHNADITAQAEFPDLDWTSVNAGDTVMHIAAGKGSIDAIQILLKAYNEMSGAIISDTSLPRRVRDPRAMRNDYGRLPYHLAMRKGFSWLGELLDPSVPVRYLLTGENLVSGTTWGPPRLATIAAAVLHESLVADLNNIRELTKADAAAAIKAAITAKVTASLEFNAIPVDVDCILAEYCYPQEQEAQQTAEQDCQQDVQGDNVSDHNTTGAEISPPGTQKRRWSLTGQHRRSLSGGRGNNRVAAAEQAGSRPPSRRSLGSLGHSRRGSRGQGDFGPPPSPLSPRMLMSVVLGGAAAAAANAEQQGFEHDQKGLDKAVSPGELPLTPKQLVASQESAPVDAAKHLTEQHQRDMVPRSSSSSPCILDEGCLRCSNNDVGWAVPSLSSSLIGLPASPSNQQQPPTSSDPAPVKAGSARSENLLDTMFKKYTWNKCVKPGMHRCRAESEGEDSRTCGVCLENVPTACILPCDHCMCAGCALDMLERFSISTAVCPFCRGIIKGFGPTNLATLASMPATVESTEYLIEL